MKDEDFRRYFQSEMTFAEYADFIDSAADESNEDKFRGQLRGHFNELTDESSLFETSDLDHLLHKIHYNINRNNTHRKIGDKPALRIFRTLSRIAAILIIPLALGLFYTINRLHEGRKNASLEIYSPDWTRTRFNLPDGTSGWLAGGSRLSYMRETGGDRMVSLHGEAYFEVFKERDNHFEVTAGEIIVKVHGTKFNLASYENERFAEVVLEEGSLCVSKKNSDESILLEPNQMVTYSNLEDSFKKENVLPSKYTSWTEGKLVFRNDDPATVARKLARWYNINVELTGIWSEDVRLRATFVEHSLDQVMVLLERTLPVDCRLEEGKMLQDNTLTRRTLYITPKY